MLARKPRWAACFRPSRLARRLAHRLEAHLANAAAHFSQASRFNLELLVLTQRTAAQRIKDRVLN